MSLKIWLPLTGNLQNKGLSDITATTNNTITYTNVSGGKIGQCANVGSGQIRIPFDGFSSSASIAFWVYGGASIPAWTDIICFGEGNNRLEKDNVTNQYRWYNDSNTTPLLASGTIVLEIVAGVWTHIAITTDGTNVSFYKNGVLYKTVPQLNSWSDCTKTTKELRLSGRMNGGSVYQGWLNDVRIYDHCLSVKEVKEVSQALICHYKMDELGCAGNPNLLINSKEVVYNATAPSTTGVNFKEWWGMGLKTGVTYTLSFYAWLDTTNDSLCQGMCRDLYPDVLPQSNIPFSVDGITNKKKKFVWTFSSTNSNMTNCAVRLFVDFANSSGQKIVGAPVHIEQIKLEESSVATEWCPSSNDMYYSLLGYDDTTIYDCSGLGNNSPFNQNLNVTTGNKYLNSLSFNGSSSYIRVPRETKVTDQITVACWAYNDNWQSGIYRLASCTESGGWNFQHATDGGTNLQFVAYAGGSYAHSNTAGSLSAGWHHFVGTWDGLSINFYVDGVAKGALDGTQTTRTPITYHASNYPLIGAEVAGGSNPAGQYFNGKINDFRIYATALSADDVKTLYNVRTAIDKTANIYSGELIEQDGVSGFEKNFIAHSTTFTEFQCLTKDMMNWTNNNIESDGKITTHNNKLSEPICVRGFQYLKIDNLATTTHYIIVASCREDGSIIAKDGIGKGSIAKGASSGVITIGNYEYIRILQWDQPSSPIPFNLYLYSGTQNVANIGKVKSSIDGQSFYEN